MSPLGLPFSIVTKGFFPMVSSLVIAFYLFHLCRLQQRFGASQPTTRMITPFQVGNFQLGTPAQFIVADDIGRGTAGGDATWRAVEAGAGWRCGAVGEGEGAGESQNGPFLPEAEAAIRVWQGALPWADEEHWAAGAALRAGPSALLSIRSHPGRHCPSRCYLTDVLPSYSPPHGPVSGIPVLSTSLDRSVNSKANCSGDKCA